MFAVGGCEWMDIQRRMEKGMDQLHIYTHIYMQTRPPVQVLLGQSEIRGVEPQLNVLRVARRGDAEAVAVFIWYCSVCWD